MKILIIEDQIPTQNLIEGVLKDYCPYVTICGKAANISTAKKMIKQSKPDLIISDIMLGEENSFDLFKALKKDDFCCKIIFISAHDSFLLPAFDFEPLGFLLKPIDIDSLVKLVEKQKNRMADNESSILAKDKIIFKTQEGWHIVELDNIIRCESDKGYSTIFTKKQGNITLAKKIIDIQKVICAANFLRIHQSHIVNINEVELLKKGRNTTLRLSDGSILPVSTSKRQIVFEKVSNFPGI